MEKSKPFWSAATPRAHLDLSELRRQVMGQISLAVTVLTGVAGLLVLPGLHFDSILFWALFVVFSASYAAYRLTENRLRLARALLTIGLLSGYGLGLFLFPYPESRYVGALIVLLLAAVQMSLGISSAVVISLMIVSTGWEASTVLALVSVWIALGCQWISSQALYTALNWAWTNQEQASKLLWALREKQGEQARTLAALTEATRRLQRTGYQLHIARMRAEQLREVKTSLAANISHELRTPLNLILGFSETMYFSPELYGSMRWPTTLCRDVSHIYHASRQLLDLLDDVLDLSRMDVAQMPISREWFSLDDIIHESLETVGHLVKSDRVSIFAVLPNDLPELLIDRTRIRQVLINLLNNAARFTEHGEISIRVSVGADECVISVQDTGTGIPADEIEHIFDVFHQIDLSIRRPTGGTGLGLGISKRFVELHGGRIWVESIEGHGSTFHFSLPRSVRVLSPQLLDVPTQRWVHNVPEPCVLIVDSDASVGDRLEPEMEGYRILQVDDADEALDAIKRWDPMAVIVNQSPRIKGLGSVAQQLYDSVDELVPILVSSMPSDSWLTQELNVQGSLTKPISRQTLLEQLEKMSGVRDILIVDDDRTFVQLVNRYLEMSEAYTLRSAYSAVEALEEMRRMRPDLLLLDLAMPDVNGLELLAWINEDQALCETPTVIVTATDYGRTVQASHGGLIAMARRQPFGATETSAQIRSLLDSCQPTDPQSLSEPLEALNP